MRRPWRVFCALSALAALLLPNSCGAGGASLSRENEASESTAPAQSTVHSITLPHFEPPLPIAPGRDEYLAVCVSCHSPRYVMMQPFFAQKQWEETVDKMAKVYGAQMDSGQKTAIVQYLAATHGPDSAGAPSPDEDSDFGAGARAAGRPESGPPLETASEEPEHKRQVERGTELFGQYCAACHGPTGQGNGWIAPVLLRKPKNLASARYSLALLSQVFWNGKPGTAMPSWRALAKTDLNALATFVQSLHPKAAPEETAPEPLQRGRQVFLQNCAPCHGTAGDGTGTAALALLPQPANFQLKQPDFDYVLQVLSEGIQGTGMPAWKSQISEPDRQALAQFVRSLFKEAADKR